MKAIAYQKPYRLDPHDLFQLIESEQPVAQGHDLLIQVQAISINPIDIKVRQRTPEDNTDWKILGRDAVGVVAAIGECVQNFKVGDPVYYAGTINRNGSYAEYQLVDERIVGHKPMSISNAQAAALPLTSITAWEMLFQRLEVERPIAGQSRSILLIGAAGGVGSIAIQLLKARTDLEVIATASRAESKQWLKQIGADYILDHSHGLTAQMNALGLAQPGYIFSISGSDQHLEDIQQLIAPQGRVGLIDDPADFSIQGFKAKSVSIHWESMFTRSVFQTQDMPQQAEILNQVATLVDHGKIKSTLAQNLGAINAAHIQQAHDLIETGKSIGKIVLEGF
ncbi:NADPH2:quinone reductase [Acinetobacter calcoaceticus]|uniref:Zinc-type alcohol dehydrogenase-like protein n=1 Tax=Acinetobacter calcoaceticus TaxID=471 RepID=A0A4R1Y9W2_ACICA|nr:NADPH2:quinone reductase [Acinetobacter calcoaceticus]